MPRKGFVPRREVPSDAVYNSDLVQKFINSMMWDGKRSTAQRIFYGALEQMGQKANDEPLKLFKKAIENVKPEPGSWRRPPGAISLPAPA